MALEAHSSHNLVGWQANELLFHSALAAPQADRARPEPRLDWLRLLELLACPARRLPLAGAWGRERVRPAVATAKNTDPTAVAHHDRARRRPDVPHVSRVVLLSS